MHILILVIEFSFPERFIGALCVKQFENNKHSLSRNRMESLLIQGVSFSDLF